MDKKEYIIFRLQDGTDLSGSLKHWDDSVMYDENRISIIESSNTATTVTESGSSAAVNSDQTTADGKMPYTGVTNKMLGIFGLVAALIAIVVYTEVQNKKNKRK